MKTYLQRILTVTLDINNQQNQEGSYLSYTRVLVSFETIY